MKKYLLLAILFISPITTNAELTTIKPGIMLYSEYYPNQSATFKGTILFENGSGTDISEWKQNKNFFNCAKQIGSLFLYDRNGLGKSPADFNIGPEYPLTAKRVSDHFYALLKHRKIKPPYIIVAHSYGALYAGFFALKNPRLVKGLVLVDPVPRDFHFGLKISAKYKSGLNQAMQQPASFIYQRYGGSQAEVIYQLLGIKQSIESIRQLGGIKDDLPIIILSSTGTQKQHPLKEDWYRTQRQWLNNNPRSKIIKVSSGHFIQVFRPEVVCHAIKIIAQ